MKKILRLIILLIVIFPVTLFASEKEYNTLDLKEALDEEQIEYVFDEEEYKDSDDKITIYLFRGNGCGVCRKFLTFLNSITDEYGKYYRLESYEIYKDSKNNTLMKKVGNFMGDTVTGVPYIVIGDKTFPGYAEELNDEIKYAIKKLYDSKEKYDVFDEMEKENEPSKIDIEPIILYNVLFTAISTITIVMVLNNKVKKLEENIKNLSKKKK